MKRIIVALLLAALAGQASATLGSIISSFQIAKETYRLHVDSVYRDPNYVYHLWYFGPMGYLNVRTPAGSFVRTIQLSYYEYSYESDRCHLGHPYFTSLDMLGWVNFINIETGYINFNWSFSVRNGGSWPTNILWDGHYYYVNGGKDYGAFRRFTPTGSLAGTWVAAGWPAGMMSQGIAFAHNVNAASGRYLVAAPRPSFNYCVIDMDTGSLVATWPKTFPSYFGAVYGDGSSPSFGATLWECSYFESTEVTWIYQTDLNARGATNVLPASIGKIKAIYR